MPTTESVPTVNRTAVKEVDAAGDTISLVHYYLTADTDRNEEQALRWIGTAITKLNAAADAIHTGLAREVQQ